MSCLNVDTLTPRRIFFDLSFSCTSGKTSGIERVVRSLLREGEKRSEEHSASIEFVPVFAASGAFFRWNEETQLILSRVSEFERDCLSQLPRCYQRLVALLCRCLPHPMLKRCLLPPSGHLGVFKPWFRRWKSHAIMRAAAGQPAITMNSQDILWLPDAYWAQPGVWPAVREARRGGALVATLAYDLIPLRSNNPNPAFAEYLSRLLAESDLVLCISDCERQHLLDFQANMSGTSQLRNDFRTISLGCEFQHESGHVRPQFTLPFSQTIRSNKSVGHSDYTHQCVANEGLQTPAEPVYLCVNTFDPRKNHALLLDTFDRLWTSGSAARLCLIGRVGWQCKSTLERIAKHAELKRRLFVFHDATDAEVNYCYKLARGVLTASKDEGFGLSVVEALAHGRPTFASNIPIHREVGGSACHYFDPEQEDELVQLIRRDLAGELELPNAGRSVEVRQPKIQSWLDSFEQCWTEIVSCYPKRLSQTSQSIGEPPLAFPGRTKAA